MRRTIFSVNLANRLISQGFKVVDAGINFENEKKIVLYFEVPENLLFDFNEEIENFKKEKLIEDSNKNLKE